MYQFIIMRGSNNKYSLHTNAMLLNIYSQQSNVNNYKQLYVNIVDVFVFNIK